MLPVYQGEIERVVIVTDAWEPQINGVVRTLRTTAQVLRTMGLDVHVITPQDFNTMPCPTYPSIPLSILPGEKVRKRITELAPSALHIATEGPLGWAARNFAVEMGIPFTTAYHTRFPEYIHARLSLPIDVTYSYLHFFHRFSRSIMVPTPMVKRDLESRHFPNVNLWSRGVDVEIFKPPESGTRVSRGHPDWPIFLYAGRVAVEKNVEAFLKLDLPGKKWVVGDGPALEALKEAYPEAVYWGFQNQTELAKLYQQSCVFVFPSRTDTFGLVLLEAMATGLPVAAYPVSGPIDVVGNSGVGILDEDLRSACLRALDIKPQAARAHAEKYSWQAATQMFLNNLKYIPPCVFAESIRSWSNARFLDDGAQLVSHLPDKLYNLLMDDTHACTFAPLLLEEGGGVSVYEGTPAAMTVRRQLEENSSSSSSNHHRVSLLPSPSSSSSSKKDLRQDVLAAWKATTAEQGPSIFSWAFIAILVMAIISRLFVVKRRKRRASFAYSKLSTSPERPSLLDQLALHPGGTP